MKNTSKLLIALSVTLVLGLVSISGWAAPSRQGTVPLTPDITKIEGLIPVTGGCYQVTLAGDCEATGTVRRFNNPGKQIGPANTGLEFLTWAVKIELDGPCSAEICFPYPPESEKKGAEIYKWDPATKLWEMVESKVSGDPALKCVVEEVDKDSAYALLGN